MDLFIRQSNKMACSLCLTLPDQAFDMPDFRYIYFTIFFTLKELYGGIINSPGFNTSNFELIVVITTKLAKRKASSSATAIFPEV